MVQRACLTQLQKSLVPKTIKNRDSLKSFEQKIRKWKPDCPCTLCKVYLFTSCWFHLIISYLVLLLSLLLESLLTDILVVLLLSLLPFYKLDVH